MHDILVAVDEIFSQGGEHCLVRFKVSLNVQYAVEQGAMLHERVYTKYIHQVRMLVLVGVPCSP